MIDAPPRRLSKYAAKKMRQAEEMRRPEPEPEPRPVRVVLPEVRVTLGFDDLTEEEQAIYVRLLKAWRLRRPDGWVKAKPSAEMKREFRQRAIEEAGRSTM